MKRRRSTPEAQREDMVEHQLRPRGITDGAVLAAMGDVPREVFVSEGFERHAYDDRPLPIESHQTISQPFIVALMAQAAELTPDSRVLEIGAGSGYGAAVLSRLAAHVWTIERHANLAEQARDRLVSAGFDNVTVVTGDGTRGLAEHAPFDAIVVTAGAHRVPDELVDQLAEGGRLVIPVDRDLGQELMRIRRVVDEVVEEELGGVRFVPLIPD